MSTLASENQCYVYAWGDYSEIQASPRSDGSCDATLDAYSLKETRTENGEMKCIYEVSCGSPLASGLKLRMNYDWYSDLNEFRCGKGYFDADLESRWCASKEFNLECQNPEYLNGKAAS